MKVKTCPKCGSDDLGDRWVNRRKLKQYCHDEDCGWLGNARIPEKIPIRSTKTIVVGQFSGYEYEIFDRYGQVSMLSQIYSSETSAFKAMEKDIQHGENNPDAGTYTGLLWPSVVKVTGKKFIVKKGKVTQVNT